MFDLGIVGGLLVLETGIIKANVYVKKGIIAGISSELFSSEEEIDATGLYVFPGGIDPHVHFSDPGMTENEDFYTGTASAAAGGVTTVLEMPLTIPVTTDEESFLLKKNEAKKKAVVDFGLYLALTPKNHDQIESLMALRPIAFKAFMSYSPFIEMVNDGYLYAGMKNLAKAGGRLALHCENNDIINYLIEKLQKENRNDPVAYTEGRPAFAEAESIQRVISLAKETGVQLHVVHSSTPEGANIVSEAQRQGYPISVETAPQFLLLNIEDLKEKGPYAQCNPPLREEKNRENLWNSLINGRIDCFGSDHVAYSFEQKEAGMNNIWKSPAGITGVQTMIPMILSEGIERKMSFENLAYIMSTSPAKIFGMYPKKGTIKIGSDGDFFLYNANEVWTVKTEDLHYKKPWTPYENKKVKGKIKKTIVRGNIVFDDFDSKGKIVVKPGYGEFFPGIHIGGKQ